MIYISRWSIITVAALIIFAVLWSVPNVLPANVRDSLPNWLPKNTMSLGLDLRGGSYLLLEVDIAGVNRERLETMRADLRAALRRERIGYTGLELRNNGVTLRVTDAARADQARTIINNLANPGGTLFGVTQQQYDIVQNGPGRIDELGSREATIQMQGQDRILVQVPGLEDPEELKRILSTTAKMTFRLVDVNGDVQGALQGRIPIEDELLYETGPNNQQVPLLVQRRVMVSGDRLTQASPSFDQRNGQPVVSFRFDARGAREFGDVTRTNVGRPFAIVLDNKVISAPVIQEPILGGSGQISGNFTVQAANDLAVLLNAGALPAALRVIEERTVGAELGADSVSAGGQASIIGLAAVVAFMLASYGLFGGFAAIGLLVNMVLLIAVLTALQATLTLPGIAGIVLTMGMAVDANVLIYERIREEMHAGKTLVAAIDTGFRRAMSAIIDSNLTTLLAALILFQLGSGPVRGFAVTLGLGIITSFFSAIMVTRLIVVLWMRRARPKALTL
jgi:protein-export membrane protein SecD